MALDTYHFTLVVDLPEEDEDIDVLLFRSGCMDATASVQGGELVIDFARVAPTRQSALISARRSIEDLGFVIRRLEQNEVEEPTRFA